MEIFWIVAIIFKMKNNTDIGENCPAIKKN